MLSPRATNDADAETGDDAQTLEDIFGAIRAHAGLWVPSSPSELVATAIEGDSPTFGRRSGEWPTARPVVPLTAAALRGPEDARALLAFTDLARARLFASRRGWDPLVSLPSHAAPWLPVLRRIVAEPWSGLVVDTVHDRPFIVSKALAERVFARLNRERWAHLPEWYVLTSNGGVAVERSLQDGFVVWAFDSMEHAHRGIDRFLRRDPGISIASFLTTALVRDLVEAGITCVHVNAGLHDEHRYDLTDLRAMAGTPDSPSEPPTCLDVFTDATLSAWAVEAWRLAMPLEPAIATQAGDTPDVGLEQASVTASRRPGSPPTHAPVGLPRHQSALPRLERAEDDVRRQVMRLGKRFETPYVPQWELVEDLAFNFDLWVLHAEDDRWPMVDGDHAHVFVGAAEARRAAKQRSAAAVRMRGLEVMRWTWAHSNRTSMVLMDMPAGPARLPLGWPLAALCPLAYDIADARRVPQVGLPRLSSLPGVRGLRPEVLKALAHGWRQLLGVRRRGQPFTILRDDGPYLAVCTDADEFFRLAARDQCTDLQPEPAVAPPFEAWLRGGDGWHGVSINPASTAPVLLDRTALIAVSAWAAGGGPPSIDDVVATAGSLQRDGALPPDAAGRIVGDLPQLVCCGAPERPGTLDGDGLVFSSTGRCASFFEALGGDIAQARGELSFPAGSSANVVAAGWRRSLLEQMPASIERVLVNPSPDGQAELTLDAAALACARARLTEIFRPRVDRYSEFEASDWLSA